MSVRVCVRVGAAMGQKERKGGAGCPLPQVHQRCMGWFVRHEALLQQKHAAVEQSPVVVLYCAELPTRLS